MARVTHCSKGQIPKSSKLWKLKPFLDENEILRANGRATKILNIEFNNFPIILSGDHVATRALVVQYHRRY